MSKRGRYWIFAFDGYYPRGGMNDFKFSFNKVEEFEEKINKFIGYDKYQILDIDSHYHFQGDFGTVVKWVCKNIGDDRYEETDY